MTGATLQFGSLPPVSSPSTATRPSSFLLKLSAANVPEWVLAGNPATATTYNAFNDVKVSSSGHVYALGSTAGPLTLGTQPVPNPHPAAPPLCCSLRAAAPSGAVLSAASATPVAWRWGHAKTCTLAR